MFKSATIAGLIAIAAWFGCCIGFGVETTQSYIGAPIVFAVAFGIATVIGKVTGNRAHRTG